MDKAIDADLNTPAIERLVAELRSKGSEALHRGDGFAAEEAYTSLLSLDARNLYGLVGLGLAAKVSGRHDEALSCLESAAAAWPRHPWPLLEIGSVLRSCQRVEEAEQVLRRALKLDPGHLYVLLALGDLLVQRGELNEAVELFRVAVRRAPHNANAHSILASTLALTGAFEDAITALSEGLEVAKDTYALWCAKARLQRRLGRNEEAVKAWKAAFSEKPEQLILKLEIASDLCAIGLHADALSAYREVIQEERLTSAQRHQAALAAGRLARDKLRDASTAIGFFEQSATLNQDDMQGVSELAQQYRMANRFKDSERLYCKMLARVPEDVVALAGLATLKRLSGEAQNALPLIEKACAINPKGDWSRLEFGYVLRDVGRMEEAAAQFEAIETDSPVRVHALMALGQMAQTRGDYRSAANFFNLATGKAGNPTDALGNLARARSAMGDFPAAEEAIARLLAHDPASFVVLMEVGKLRLAMNDRSGARAAFLQAAEANPADAKPYVEMAVEAMSRDDVKGAAAALEIALRVDPAHWDALLKKGALLAGQGENEAALTIYMRLQADRPDAVSSYLAAAELMAKLGEADAALKLLGTAREKCPPNSQIDFKEAGILRQVGRLDQSLELITMAHEAFPRDFWSWYLRTSICIDLGRFDEADALFAAQPALLSRQERGHVLKLRVQLLKARWSLEKAIETLDAAIELDSKDVVAREERAKLKLMVFDLPGAWSDLKARAETRSASTRRKINPMHSHAGQLYEEYIFDTTLADRLGALRGAPPPEQVPQLIRLARDFPDSTGPAIGLMIALRRSGRFDSPSAGESAFGKGCSIPKLITRFWNDPEPPADVARLMASWNECEPEFKIESFDDYAAINYLRARCTPKIADAFHRAGEPAQRADLFRLARLQQEGGFFIDADDRARGGLSEYVPPRASFFAHQEDPGSIGNNVLGATPCHPVIEKALNEGAAAILRGDRDIVWLTTGPGLLTRAFANWLASVPEQLDERLSTVAILTLAQIRRAAAVHCYAGYKNTGRAWLSGAFRKATRRTESRMA